MTTTVIQNSFIAGEISPSLYGRTDMAKWKNGASTMRNMFVNFRGGSSSRAGTLFAGASFQPGTSAPPRDIPFQFNISQGFVLEFGEFYMAVKSQGAYVTYAPQAIQGITQSNPAILNINAHGYSPGSHIAINGVLGMTEFNGQTWIVNSAIDVNHVTVENILGVSVDSTLFPAYISGGTSALLYFIISPYAAVDLPYLKFTQSADVMSLCCINQQTLAEYPTYNLQRFGDTNWQFSQVSFSSSIGPPNLLTFTANSSTTKDTLYLYVVTAVADTGEESIASPVVGGLNNNISINAGTNIIGWNAVPGAVSYNIYQATPIYQGTTAPAGIPYSYIGTATGTTFIAGNITADATRTPPLHFDPFSSQGITNVVPTNGGNGAYTQANIGYTVNTTTGSGFFGVPTVTNGFFSGFTILSSGANFNPATDTITITSGSVGPPAAATGTYTFINNPSIGQTLVLNGVAWSFFLQGHAPPTPSQTFTVLGGTLALTLNSLVINLNASTNPAISVASYSVAGSVLIITYKTVGTVGNGYTLAAGTYGGVPSGATLTGGVDAGAGGGAGATAMLVFSNLDGNNPSVVAYYQERRVYANTVNEPDTYFFSRPGAFQNMDSAIPTVDDDAIIGTPWAQQINGIQFMVPMPGGLVILTGKGAWQLNGGNNAALTPSSQTATPQAYNGCNAVVPPITINYDILYVQTKGSIVRDLAYNFFINIYTGNDLTVLSNQLFDNHSILQWTWAEEPYKLVWAVRDDGVLLSLTYLKEQDVYAWARHDTNGIVVSVCSITERHQADYVSGNLTGPLTDAVYIIVKRYIQGAWRYYSERMDDRNWQNIEHCWCVDSALQYPQNFPNATLTPSAATGTATFTANASVFTPANVGDVIRVGGGIATVTSYISGVQVIGTVTQAITSVVPDNPSAMPVPAAVGQWSITTPTATVGGLTQLEGLIVTGLADGGVIAPQTVTNGTITLPQAASSIVVGLPFLPQLQTLYLDPPSQTGTTQTKRKTINSVGIRLDASRGISIGTNQVDASTQPNNATVPWSGLIEIKERNIAVNAGSAIPLYTGDYFINVSSGWDERSQVAVQQNYPLPVNCLALVTYFNQGDT